MFVKKNILGVNFTDASEREVLEYIVKNLKRPQKKYYVVTLNPEILVMANKNSGYRNVLNSANLALADGVGVILVGEFLGKSIKERMPGVDLVASLCRDIAKRPITVSFLGGGPKIAKRASECLRQKYPGLKVSFASQNPPRDLKKLSCDILFVAFGSPKQEFWIYENLEKLPVRVAIGVGGAFDFISGKIPRAPKWLQDLGFEWFFRLIVEPWRIKRQFKLLKFVYLVIAEKFSL